MTETLKEFSQQVKNEMTNCRYCLETKPITRDLAKDCMELALAMLDKFRDIAEDGGFDNDDEHLVLTLQDRLDDWVSYSKKLFYGTTALSQLWVWCGIELEKDNAVIA